MRHGVTMRCIGALLMLVAGAPALGQSAGERWQYEATPYLWMSGMKGSVQAGNLPRTNVDMSFGDIVDVLDFGVMGALEARKGRLGLLFDALYMKVSDSATASRPVGPATLFAHADARLEQTMLSAAVAWRVTQDAMPVDVIGGLRYSRMDVDANIDASLFGLTGRAIRSGNKDWVDPYVGLRVRAPIAPRWTLSGYGDVGGFGVGADFTWQIALGLDYEMSKSSVVKVGYRQIGVDYDNGGFVYDMDTRGVFLGVGFRF